MRKRKECEKKKRKLTLLEGDASYGSGSHPVTHQSAICNPVTLQKYHEDTQFDTTFIINDLRIRDISFLLQKYYEVHPASDS